MNENTYWISLYGLYSSMAFKVVVDIFVVGRALLSEISPPLSRKSRKISNITSAFHFHTSLKLQTNSFELQGLYP